MMAKNQEIKPLPAEFNLTIFAWHDPKVFSATGYLHNEVRTVCSTELMYIIKDLFDVRGLNVMLKRHETGVTLFVSDGNFGQS